MMRTCVDEATKDEDMLSRCDVASLEQLRAALGKGDSEVCMWPIRPITLLGHHSSERSWLVPSLLMQP